MDTGPCFVVKRISVEPGQRLSLQLHHYRSESWVVVSGRAWVQCGTKEFALEASQSTFIPVATKHRIENVGEGLLEFIEVQYGEELDENDIIRFEDDYERL